MDDRIWTRVIGLMMVAGLAAGALAGEPAGVAGTVEEVTLYRGQAMVTRTVPIDAPAGRVEFVVADLPQQVVSDSLFAEGGDGIDVRAVRYRTRAVGEEPRDEVRQLDQQIEQLQVKVNKNKKMQQLISQRLSFMDKLENFTAPTAEVEMTKGVLNVDALKQITLFSFDERQKAAEESLTLEAEAKDLNEQISLLQRQRAKLTAGASRTVREAVLFLEKRNAAIGQVRLSYVVRGAGWSPGYNFRADDGKQVRVEYNAIIQQMSGENWNDVKLTLSTASPALSAQGPGLAPFRVALARSPAGKGKLAQLDVLNQLRSHRGRLRSAQLKQQSAQALSENIRYNWDMNVAANDFQQLELVVGKDALQVMQMETPSASEGPSVSYSLADPVSLASRSDQQMLRISDMRLDSTFYHVATPILASYVFREAELKNTGEDALLAGPVSVYLKGRFVGRGEIPTVARGQTFVIGFGADPQLRARRELVKKAERAQGGNREVDFSYRLVMENYKDIAVAMRLIDRMPIADREADIRVTMAPMEKDKLSEDELYLRVEKPKGILRWDIEVPARSAGAKARIVEYGYKLEFDRTQYVSIPTKGRFQEMQQEFEQMRDTLMRR